MLLLCYFAVGTFHAYFIHRLINALLNFIFNVASAMNTDTSHADNIIRSPKGLIRGQGTIPVIINTKKTWFTKIIRTNYFSLILLMPSF